jgi:hypothetical protein
MGVHQAQEFHVQIALKKPVTDGMGERIEHLLEDYECHDWSLDEYQIVVDGFYDEIVAEHVDSELQMILMGY